MKKTFLKASLLSLMLGVVSSTMLVSCSYGDDIDRLTQTDEVMQGDVDKLAQQREALQNQLNTLSSALDEQKAEVARAQAAADKAAEAAAAAQAAADKAQQTGDAAQAAAEAANAAAQAANAEALAAQAASTQAKADAIEDAIKQVQALRDEINGQIAELKKEFGDKYDELASALAKAATKSELDDAVKSLQAAIEVSRLTKAEIEEMLSEYIAQINSNTTEIAALSGKIDGISTQLNTLAGELGNLKTTVAENTSAIAANAASIAEQTQRINEIVENVIPGISERIDALDGKVSVLESNYTDLQGQVAALNAFKTQAETQLAALEAFKEECETTLAGIKSDIADINSRIEAIESDIEDAKAKIEANAAAISEINGTITELKGSVEENASAIAELQGELAGVQQEINKINAALSTLNAINAKRLTSVTLVPQSYVGGIPTIEFYSASYQPWGQMDSNGFYAAPSLEDEPVIFTNDDTYAYYRLNPAGVTEEDIVKGKISFVQMTATSRAVETPVVKVVNDRVVIENGMLKVFATKNDGVTGTIDNAGDGRIYTIALKVPIAEKNYYTFADGTKEDAEDAVVYSEYSRVSETTFVPEIAWNKAAKPVHHFWSKDEMWADVNGDIESVVVVDYTTADYDLTSLVTGCMLKADEHELMTPEQVNSFGFTFEYSVPKQAYTLNGVNQQLYASVTPDGKLTATSPANEAAAARVGKTPVISVVMKHGNDVVDQRFFKIRYKVEIPTEFEIPVFSVELPCRYLVEDVTWESFIENVINNIPDMDKATFLANFKVKSVEGLTKILTEAYTQDLEYLLQWRLNLGDIGNINGTTKEFTATVVFESDLFGEITVTLKGEVKMPAVLPSLGRTDGIYWTNGVMEVLPVGMPVPYDNSTTADYNTDVFVGRYRSYINDLLECSNWDVQVKAVTGGFSSAAAQVPVYSGKDGYTIVKDGVTAATIWYEDDEHEPFSLGQADAADQLELYFHIDNNDAGIDLVSNENTVDLGWYIELNGDATRQPAKYNMHSLYDTSLKIRKPLQKVNAGTIEPLTQSSSVQYRDLSEGMTITDCFGIVFDENGSTDGVAGYWEYYVIDNVVWGEFEPETADPDNAYYGKVYITDVDGSNSRLLTDVNQHLHAAIDPESGLLSFTGSGVNLQKPFILKVPVSIYHKWGVLHAYVDVQVNPGMK